MKRSEFPAPREGFVVAHFITVSDKRRSTTFYTDVMRGSLVRDGGDGGVNVVRLANSWIIIHSQEPPSLDKPGVTLLPPSDPSKVHSFLEVRVAKFWDTYNYLKSKGVEFLGEPIDRHHEIRCFMRDPDGYLIEIGEATGVLEEIDDL